MPARNLQTGPISPRLPPTAAGIAMVNRALGRPPGIDGITILNGVGFANTDPQSIASAAVTFLNAAVPVGFTDQIAAQLFFTKSCAQSPGPLQTPLWACLPVGQTSGPAGSNAFIGIMANAFGFLYCTASFLSFANLIGGTYLGYTLSGVPWTGAPPMVDPAGAQSAGLRFIGVQALTGPGLLGAKNGNPTVTPAL